MAGRTAWKLLTRSVIAAACALGLAVTAPAVADSAGGITHTDAPAAPGAPEPVKGPGMVVRPAAADSFTLVVRPHGQAARTVALNCRPVSGNHPAARAACDQIQATRGRIAAIPPADTLCTAEHAPVTVTARGAWHTEPRAYRKTFSNICVAVRDTGGVLFDF
ncbi:MAG: hypothetical protein GEU94_08020 [Micromonosporaceae bacterium]|nr:hypothetical protein [Micromonosporaceae bacterium]